MSDAAEVFDHAYEAVAEVGDACGPGGALGLADPALAADLRRRARQFAARLGAARLRLMAAPDGGDDPPVFRAVCRWRKHDGSGAALTSAGALMVKRGAAGRWRVCLPACTPEQALKYVERLEGRWVRIEDWY